MCIVLDHIVLSCPRIQAVLREGGLISGQFTRESANNLALTLNYGSLPVAMKIKTTRDIGATLGTDSIRRSLIAGAIAFVVMCIFSVLYYRLPGVIGALSLLFFTFATLALFVLIPITMTLPGIAGFVLSIATAADANILVFERFKESLRAGRTVRAAVEAAFNRAWPSIRDSNMSTLLTCFILFVFGWDVWRERGARLRAQLGHRYRHVAVLGHVCHAHTDAHGVWQPTQRSYGAAQGAAGSLVKDEVRRMKDEVIRHFIPHPSYFSLLNNV